MVNWIWIKGLVDLSAKKRATVKRDFGAEVARPLNVNTPGHRLVKTGRIRTDSGVHPIYAVVTRNFRQDLPRIILSAGIHGEEPAGVYTLLAFLNRGIANYLKQFSFLILPCLNPYGFTRGVHFSREVSDLNRSFDDAPGLRKWRLSRRYFDGFPAPTAWP